MLIHLGSDVGSMSGWRQMVFSCVCVCVCVLSLLIGFSDRGKWQISSLRPRHRRSAPFTLQFASKLAHVTWRLTTGSWLNKQAKDLFFKIYAIIVAEAGRPSMSQQPVQAVGGIWMCGSHWSTPQRSEVSCKWCCVQPRCSDALLHNDIVLYEHADDPMVCSISNPDFVVYSSVVSFYLPFIVTLLVYIRIYVFLRMRRKRITFGQASGKVLPDSTPPSVVGHSSFTSVCQSLCVVVHFNEGFFFFFY